MRQNDTTTARTAREMPYYRNRAPRAAVAVAMAAVPVVAMYAVTHPVVAVAAVTTMAAFVATRAGGVRDD